jgi:hypothetical protein
MKDEQEEGGAFAFVSFASLLSLLLSLSPPPPLTHKLSVTTVDPLVRHLSLSSLLVVAHTFLLIITPPV